MAAFLSAIWVLVVTVLVLVLAYWATRFLAGRMSTGQLVRGRRIEVLEQIPVGKDQKLMLVRMGEKTCFLGVTPSGITILREATEEELSAWQTSEPQPEPLTSSFARALHQAMEQRTKGR